MARVNMSIGKFTTQTFSNTKGRVGRICKLPQVREYNVHFTFESTGTFTT